MLGARFLMADNRMNTGTNSNGISIRWRANADGGPMPFRSYVLAALWSKICKMVRPVMWSQQQMTNPRRRVGLIHWMGL